MQISAESLLPWIVLLPLVGALANGLNVYFKGEAPKPLVTGIAVGAVFLSFVVTVVAFMDLVRLGPGSRATAHLYDWFTLTFGERSIPVGVTFVMDSLSGVMTLFVTGIGTLIHVYSAGYMADDPSHARFFTYLNLFMASMLILVLGSSMPLLFVGWEGVGLCSYLLIGFWFENGEYAKAGRKAFVANRIGDFGVIVGMFILMTATGSLEFADINRAAKEGALAGTFTLPRGEMLGAVTGFAVILLVLGAAAFMKKKVALHPAAWLVAALALGGGLYWLLGVSPTVSLATAACLFLFLGCAGKSAQIPLFVWLPDAMAGPTPVSALIHAATMVTAGIYLCCRLSYVFLAAPVAMTLITIVGALTALLAATIALVQNHLKRVLAYSTVSQLGFMFAAVGAGAFQAGFFHVFTHAFFKACLFLGAGAVMHAVHAHGDADVRLLGGLKKHLPVVRWTFLISCLAIAGFPLTSGFFSKDEILLGVVRSGAFLGSPTVAYFVFGTLVLAATMTAFYMFRLYCLTFEGEYRSASADQGAGHGHDAHHADAHHAYDAHPHAPEPAIAWPLLVLGAGAAFAGVLNLEPLLHLFHAHLPEPYGNLWGHWLGGTVAVAEAGDSAMEWLAPAGGFLAMAIGIGLAWSMYGSGKRLPKEHPTGLHQLLLDKWKVDELYDAVVLWPMRWLAQFAAAIDKYFVDMLFAKASAVTVRLAGWVLTRAQTGIVYAYATAMVVGVLIVGAWFLMPHPKLRVVKIEGDSVTFRAARGHGYAYRWDANGDGAFEAESFAADARELAHTFAPSERIGVVARIEGGQGGPVDIVLAHGESKVLSGRQLGAGWAATGGFGAKPPVLSAEHGVLVVRANDAAAGRDGETFELSHGETVTLGARTLRAGALVRASVEVENAFGAKRRATESVALFPVREKPKPSASAALLGGQP